MKKPDFIRFLLLNADHRPFYIKMNEKSFLNTSLVELFVLDVCFYINDYSNAKVYLTENQMLSLENYKTSENFLIPKEKSLYQVSGGCIQNEFPNYKVNIKNEKVVLTDSHEELLEMYQCPDPVNKPRTVQWKKGMVFMILEFGDVFFIDKDIPHYGLLTKSEPCMAQAVKILIPETHEAGWMIFTPAFVRYSMEKFEEFGV